MANLKRSLIQGVIDELRIAQHHKNKALNHLRALHELLTTSINWDIGLADRMVKAVEDSGGELLPSPPPSAGVENVSESPLTTPAMPTVEVATEAEEKLNQGLSEMVKRFAPKRVREAEAEAARHGDGQ